METNDFWDRVDTARKKLSIPDGTFRSWKSRGRVSREQIVDVFQALAGTEHEVSLELLNKKHTSH